MLLKWDLGNRVGMAGTGAGLQHCSRARGCCRVRRAVPATTFACAQPLVFICVKKEPLSWNKLKEFSPGTKRDILTIFFPPLQSQPGLFFFFSPHILGGDVGAVRHGALLRLPPDPGTLWNGLCGICPVNAGDQAAGGCYQFASTYI